MSMPHRSTARATRALHLLTVFAMVFALVQAVLPIPIISPISTAYAMSSGQIASLVLGQPNFTDTTPGLSSTGMSFPQRVVVDPTTGKLFVADSSNNRVLRFSSLAALSNGTSAEAVLGQVDFTSNTSGNSADTISQPYDVAVDTGGHLWVVDSVNNRVLRFDAAATKPNGAAADGVLGQPDFTSHTAGTSATALKYPYDVDVDAAGRLWVADGGNNRVLRFDAAATKPNGAAADGVLGQPDFTSSTYGIISASSLNQPRALAADTGGHLWVVDYSVNRVLRFDDAKNKVNGAAADGVLGTVDFSSSGSFLPETWDRSFGYPHGIAVDLHGNLWVADTNLDRVLRFDHAATKVNGAAADEYFDNLRMPYGVAVDSVGRVWVADSGNNRVVMHEDPAHLSLSGNSQEISAGATLPQVANNTDFGAVGLGQSVTHSFTITNTGITTLDLTGSPTVQITGTMASDFSITKPASTPLTNGASTTFDVQFTPSAAGLRSATISIPSSDPTANPFTFAIQGTGANTAPVVSSAAFVASPNAANGTPIGTVAATDAENNIKTPGGYAITAGNTNNAFAIDNIGKITVATSASVTAGITFNLTVEVTDDAGATGSNTITITTGQATQAITFAPLPNINYGDAVGALNPTVPSGLPVTLTSATASVCTVAGSALAVQMVGTCTIIATQAGNAGNSAATPITNTFTIAKKQLTVSAPNVSRKVGEANPTFNMTYVGFAPGEDASVLTTQPTASTTANEASPARAYAITVIGGSATNYSLVYVDGTLTVTNNVTSDPNGYRDIGNVRVWADTFDNNGVTVTASGAVKLGIKSADTQNYTTSGGASWPSGSGTIKFSGDLSFLAGAQLGSGDFTADPTTGAVTWLAGSTPALTKLGTTPLTITSQIDVNLLTTQVTVHADVDLDVPENDDATASVVYTLSIDEKITSTQTAPISLTIAGGTLSADVHATKDGLVADQAQYTVDGVSPLTVSDLLIDGEDDTKLHFGTEETFPVSNIDLGSNVLLLSNLNGTLNLDDETYVISLTGNLSINKLPETLTALAPTPSNLRIEEGRVVGDVGDFEFKVGGNEIALDGVTIQHGADYRLVAEKTTWTWPESWGAHTTELKDVAIITKEPYIQIGGGSQTFTTDKEYFLGGKTDGKAKVKFDMLNATIGYETAKKAWTVGIGSRITFGLGKESTVISGTQLFMSDGVISGTISTVNFKVAGVAVKAEDLIYDNSTFTTTKVTLTLPKAWKSAKVKVKDLEISSDGFSLGGAGVTFPINDQTLGKSVKLTEIKGKINIDANSDYTLGLQADATITMGKNSTTAKGIKFTVNSDGTVSGKVSILTIKVAGLDTTATDLAYEDGTFTSNLVTITMPKLWKNASASVSKLSISNDEVSMGGAGAAFPIPDQSFSALRLTDMKGSLALQDNGDYTIGISATVTVQKVQSDKGGNLMIAGAFTVADGRVDGIIDSLNFKMSGVAFGAKKLKFVDDKFTANEVSISIPLGKGSADATLNGLEIGGSSGFKLAGGKVKLPDFKIGTVGVEGVQIEFQRQPDESYLVSGGAKFNFKTFAVDGKFTIGVSASGSIQLKMVQVAWSVDRAIDGIKLGNTGFAITRISAEFNLDDGSVTLKASLSASTLLQFGDRPVLKIIGEITLKIKPFELAANVHTELLGFEVAQVSLRITDSSFTLNGSLELLIVHASIEVTFGTDSVGEFTFYGKAHIDVDIEVLGEDFNLGNADLEAGKFQDQGSRIWGARGRGELRPLGVEIASFSVWARFSPGPVAFGSGDDLQSYQPVRPRDYKLSSTALLASGTRGMSLNTRKMFSKAITPSAAGREPLVITVTTPADRFVVVETITTTNQLAPEALVVDNKNGKPFTTNLLVDDTANHKRYYEVTFTDPANAIGEWGLLTQTGNLLNVISLLPQAQVKTFSACIDSGSCLDTNTPLTLDGSQALNLAWNTQVYTPGLALDVYAENASGKRTILAHQEDSTGLTLDSTARVQPTLASGQYTLTMELANSNIAPVKVVRGVITVKDTTPPAAPAALTSQAQGDMSALLAWDGTKAEADIAGYEVTVDGGEPIQTDGQFTQHRVEGLTVGTHHTISIAAYDLSGNIGPAATADLNTPTIGLSAAWPQRDTHTSSDAEIGASYTQAITNPNLTVVDVTGKQVEGTMTPITAEQSITETVTLGATFTPTGGMLSPGTYTATITAQDPATGNLIPVSWSFTVLQNPQYRIYLPLIRPIEQ